MAETLYVVDSAANDAMSQTVVAQVQRQALRCWVLATRILWVEGEFFCSSTTAS